MAAGQAPNRILLLGTEFTVDAFGNKTYAIAGVMTGASQPILREVDGLLSFFFRSIGTTSGGTVLIEEADWGPWEAPYSGTWSTLLSIAASTFTGGAQVAVHLQDASYGYVRVRISSDITGGGSILVS